MTWMSPFGLLALLAVPAVVALHWFRNRLPERRIAGAFLFPPQALQFGAGRVRTRLLRTPSFWCEVLAASVLALWLAGPSFGGRTATPLVVVLDDSASMAAVGARERALTKLRAALSARSARSFLAVLRTGPRPTTLLDAREVAPDVEAVLQRWQPAQPRHDVRLSLDLARELAGPAGEVLFVSDEPPPAGHDDVELLACGVPATNAALLSLQRAWRDDGLGEELRVRLAAHGAMPEVALRVWRGDAILARAEVPVVDGEAAWATPLPPGAEDVRVQLGDDALAIDNTAWLLPEPTRTVAIATALRDEVRRELAIDRLLAALPGWRTAVSERDAQLLWRHEPGPVRDGQVEVVFVPGTGERQAFRGPFVVDRAHAWLRGVTLQGVVWVAGAAELPGQVLVAAGPHVLATEEPLAQGRRLWLRLQGSAGNLVRSPDWPVWFQNVLDGCRADVPGLESPYVLVGGEARYRRGADRNVVLAVVGPDGTPRQGGDGGTAGWSIEQPGLYSVRGADDRELGRFAARFHDPSESDLRGLVGIDRAALAPTVVADGKAPLRDTGWERHALAWIAVLLLVLDWWVLARRPA